MQASGPIPPTKPSSYFAGDRLDLPNQSREGHSGGSKSNQGSSSTTESQRGGWEGRAPTYILNTSGSMHYLWAVVHRYTYTSLPWTIFLGHDQKNSLKCGSSSTLFFFLHVKTFDDVKGCCSCLEETCHRPPREETERLQRRGEKERRQSAVGHSLHIKATSFVFLLFFFVFIPTQHISAVISLRAAREGGREGGRAREREGARCLPGMWVIYVRLALQGWIMTEHMTSVWCVGAMCWLECVINRLKEDAHARQSM